MNLSVCHKDHGPVHPGAGHPISLWHNSGFEVQVAMTGQRGGVMVSKSLTIVLPPNAGQQWDDTNSMWEGGDWAAEGWPGGSEQPSGTQFEDFSPTLTVHSQDVGSHCQNHECLQLKPGIGWRHHPGPLRTSLEGGTSWWFRNSTSRGSMALWTAARGSVQHQAEPQSWS
jgi:hypothetical protein